MAIKRYEMPCGTLYVNEGNADANFYVKGELVRLKPKQSKFVGGSQQDLVHYLLYPGFWESRKVFEEAKKKGEHITVLLNMPETDRWGDALMLTLVSKAYKESYEENITIDVLVNEKVEPVWKNNPHVRYVFTEAPYDSEIKYSIKIDLDKLELKGGGKGEAKCSEIVLQKAGLYTVNKTPVYVVAEKDRASIKKVLESMGLLDGKTLIGVAAQSSAKVRSYPHMAELTDKLREQGHVIMLDAKDKNGEYLFSFADMAAIMTFCDLVVTNDSGALHLAGALKKRVVGLFGHTLGKTLIEDYEHAIAVQGSQCSLKRHPCWWDTPCLEAKSYQEAERLGPTECLEALTPDEVVAQITTALQKVRRVFVVMLTYNLLAWTKVALESIRSFHDYDIMVVDNESTDGTQEYLKSKGINFVSKRCGVAAAQNIAFREFLKGDWEYVVLLNNDIVLHYDTIDSLIRQMEADPTIAANTSFEAPNIAPWMIDTATPPGKGHSDIVDIGPGAYSCTAFTRAIVEKIGLFDEHFTPRYIEDNDYTLRLRLAGGRFVKSKESVYYHVLGAVVNTIEEEKKHRDRHWVKNIAYYTEKWGFHPHSPQRIELLGAEHRPGQLVRDIEKALERKPKANVLINRNMGGWGDIVFSTIIARELKAKYGERVAVYYNVPALYRSIISRYAYIEQHELSGTPDAFLDITDTEFRHEWQEVASTGYIQSARTEFYLWLAGIKSEAIQPDYFVSHDEREWATKFWHGVPGDGFSVVLVKTGSNKLKNWHGMDELERRLRLKGIKLVVSETAGVNRDQLAALIATSNLVISPDSGPSNVAAALDIPALTLFSNRNGQIFCRMFQTMVAIQGRCPHIVNPGFCDYKVPCAGTEGPYRPKENDLGEPDCFKRLEVDSVMALVEELL